MNGKTDKDGRLLIERGGKWKGQICHFALNIDGDISCSDNCPLFGEPKGGFKSIAGNNIPVSLDICQNRTLFFDQFTDERGKK